MATQQEQEPARDGSTAPRNKRKGSPCQQDCIADGSIASPSKRQDSSRQQDYVADGSVDLRADIINSTACEKDESSHDGRAGEFSGPDLPEDIWCHIHSLMPLRDAARAACVSRAFKFSWGCYPNLTFSKETLGLDGHVHENAETARAFTTKVDHILENHSGIGIKTLELLGAPTYNAKDRCYLDKWLQMAITPVLEELMLYFSPVNNKLNYLEVLFCEKLQVMESRAPNLTDFTLHCHSLVQLSHLASSQMKSVCMGSMGCPGVIGYIHTKLASSVPNVQSLVIYSPKEMVDAPISSKFLHLKYLNIVLTRDTFSLSYDYLSLTSFLDASPSLETFILEVWQLHMEHVSASTDPSDPREMPGHNHDKLKNVRIHGFSSTKSLIELTCHIVQIATSLQWLVLDTREGLALPDCSVNEIGECLSMPRESILEARRALVAVQTYIKPKVPSTVQFRVLEPCSRCHVVDDH